MKPPPKPANETARLEALRDYHVLDTPPEPLFDDITRLAAQLLGVPIALVSLVDASRQWFKSRYGLDAPETPRDVSFCGHAVASGGLLVVPDAFEDERFFDNPLVTGEPRVRFYAGAPLATPSGEVLGTLCAIDHQARRPDPKQLELLRVLARQVMSQLELRRQNLERRRLAAVVEATPDFVTVSDLDGRLVYLNSAARAAVGIEADAPIPRDLARVVPEWALARIMDEAIPVALREGSWAGEAALRAPDGSEIPVHQLVLAQPDEAGRIGFIASYARDIREHKRIEEFKNQFVSTVSHELRTPLTAIHGSLRLLEGGVAGEMAEEARQLVKVARHSSERLIHLVNDMLDLEKIEAGKLELALGDVAAGALVERALEGLSGMAREADVALESRVGALPEMRADPDRLLQVLTNLIGNAIKFSPQGSRVRIVAEARDARVRLAVADQGPGVAQKDLPRLFGRFEQLDSSDGRRTGGSGLGLAISKAIVEAHQGEIGVDSRPGHGATFWFEIPRA